MIEDANITCEIVGSVWYKSGHSDQCTNADLKLEKFKGNGSCIYDYIIDRTCRKMCQNNGSCLQNTLLNIGAFQTHNMDLLLSQLEHIQNNLIQRIVFQKRIKSARLIIIIHVSLPVYHEPVGRHIHHHHTQRPPLAYCDLEILWAWGPNISEPQWTEEGPCTDNSSDIAAKRNTCNMDVKARQQPVDDMCWTNATSCLLWLRKHFELAGSIFF